MERGNLNFKMKSRNSLYNPHGSDGTETLLLFISTYKYFITHTVQMEREYFIIYEPNASNFITHTVQMELNYGGSTKTVISTFITHTVQMEPYSPIHFYVKSESL